MVHYNFRFNIRNATKSPSFQLESSTHKPAKQELQFKIDHNRAALARRPHRHRPVVRVPQLAAALLVRGAGHIPCVHGNIRAVAAGALHLVDYRLGECNQDNKSFELYKTPHNRPTRNSFHLLDSDKLRGAPVGAGPEERGRQGPQVLQGVHGVA